MEDFKKILVECNDRLEETLNENIDNKVMSEINDTLREFVKKVKKAAHKCKVNLETDVEKIRAEVSKIILKMKNDRFKDSVKGDLKLNGKNLSKSINEDMACFRKEFFKEINDFIDELKKLSSQVDWLEVDAVIKPFLGVEASEKDVKEDVNFIVALNEDAMVAEVYEILNEAEDDKKKPSLQPPKEWIEKMKKEISQSSPDYSMERLLRTIGDIWYHKLSNEKKSEIRGRYGKVYGEAY